MKARFLPVLALAVGLFSEQDASAHGLDPIGVSLREEKGGAVVVRIDRPASLPNGATIGVAVDAGCEEASTSVTPGSAGRAREERHLHCRSALAGTRLTVTGLEAAGLDAVVRAELADGQIHRGVASARAPEIALAAAPSPTNAARSYLGLGAKHFALGWDHILFVLGVAWIARTARRAAIAITAFTAGHSVTLSAAALGFLRFPTAWAEIGIALTLVWLALQVLRRPADAPATGRLAIASAAMGLVHGLGFATALAHTGLPDRDVPLALFCFNLGIEIAQLALVAILYLAASLSVRTATIDRERLRPWLGHAIGALAAMWCIERVFSL
jgi:hydrogenase/urease accessory protein HupE